MEEVRKASVSGILYPATPLLLSQMLRESLNVDPSHLRNFLSKHKIRNFQGLVVPHASYYYVHSMYGHMFPLLRNRFFDLVILLGQIHSAFVQNCVVSWHTSFTTPEGSLPVDTRLVHELGFEYMNELHETEFSIELILPYLQEILDTGFHILPILVGDLDAQTRAEALARILNVYNLYTGSILVIASANLTLDAQNASPDLDQGFLTEMAKGPYRQIEAFCDHQRIPVSSLSLWMLMTELMQARNAPHFASYSYDSSQALSPLAKRHVGYCTGIFY